MNQQKLTKKRKLTLKYIVEGLKDLFTVATITLNTFVNIHYVIYGQNRIENIDTTIFLTYFIFGSFFVTSILSWWIEGDEK